MLPWGDRSASPRLPHHDPVTLSPGDRQEPFGLIKVSRTVAVLHGEADAVVPAGAVGLASRPAEPELIAAAEARLASSGRVLIRKSGTEPLIRVMAEAEDEAMLREVVDGIVAAVGRHSAGRPLG